jgi:NADH-quinone oxidoreductase subunit G
MRVWFLKQVNSIDTESSVGANTVVWSREGIIYRITPRRNDEVNDTWMADTGRVLYKQVRAENRLTAVKASGQPASVDAAIQAAGALLKSGAVAVVGSGRSSVEEQFLTKKIADASKASSYLVSRVGEGDKLLISADRNPNVRGALVTGLINKLPDTQLTELGAAIDAGKVKTVLSINEDLTAAGLTPAQLAKVQIVYVGTQGSPTSDVAQVILPTHTVFEKSGTFINQQFRLQKFLQAIPGLAGTTNDLVVLSKLLSAVGGPALSSDLPALWKTLAEEIRVFAGASFSSLMDAGLVLNSSDFANLPFCEGETLHFKPAVKAAAAAPTA